MGSSGLTRLLCLPIHEQKTFISGHGARSFKNSQSQVKTGYRVEVEVVGLYLELGPWQIQARTGTG